MPSTRGLPRNSFPSSSGVLARSPLYPRSAALTSCGTPHTPNTSACPTWGPRQAWKSKDRALAEAPAATGGAVTCRPPDPVATATSRSPAAASPSLSGRTRTTTLMLDARPVPLADRDSGAGPICGPTAPFASPRCGLRPGSGERLRGLAGALRHDCWPAAGSELRRRGERGKHRMHVRSSLIDRGSSRGPRRPPVENRHGRAPACPLRGRTPSRRPVGGGRGAE